MIQSLSVTGILVSVPDCQPADLSPETKPETRHDTFDKPKPIIGHLHGLIVSSTCTAVDFNKLFLTYD